MNNKTRNYVFTINNYTKKDLKRFHKLAESLERHRYINYGLEVAPSTGTKHIQGYIQLNEAQRITFLQNYFDFKNKDGEVLKFHASPAKGSAKDNQKYNSKDGDYYEFGEPKTQGERTDLKEIKSKLKENPTSLSMVIDEDVVNHQQYRFAQTMSEFYMQARDPEQPPIVYWISGSTGVGKTSLVYQCFGRESVCSISKWDWPGTGYAQQECLLFDDLRGENISFNTMLKITDRYPYRLEYKGGFVELNSPYIVITSPQNIRQAYGGGFVKEDVGQLERRVIEIDMDNEFEDIDLRTYHQNKKDSV